VADQGLDQTFGLQGTCTAHVSGFGGLPFAIVLGVDGRPTLACSAPVQRPAPQLGPTAVGPRFRNPPVDTPRIVSFPPDGRPENSRPFTAAPTAIPRPGAVQTFGEDPGDPFALYRAAAQAGRIAVLGNVLDGGQQLLTLQTFRAAPPVSGLSTWSATATRKLAALARGAACALGWMGSHVVVVGPAQAVGTTLRLAVYVDTTLGYATFSMPPSRLGFPAGFDVEARITSVCGDQNRLLVGITWVGLDPVKGRFRTISAIDEGRASVLALRRASAGWEPDPHFGKAGLWLAKAGAGEITTAEHVALAGGCVVVAGRAVRGGVDSLFAACLHPKTGQPKWTAYPVQGVTEAAAGITIDGGGRIFMCGSTRPFDVAYRLDDPAEAYVACLSPAGQPDPAFGTSGVARFRLNGATYARAIEATASGELLVASVIRWGWESAGGMFHPCVTRLESDGSVDEGFGLAGVCRHDGVGDARVVAVDSAAHVWTAGIGYAYEGLAPGTQTPTWLRLLTVSRLTTNGGLTTGFGLDGISKHQLPFDSYDVNSLVPLAGGGAVLAGHYERIVNNVPTAGSWVARVNATGQLDTGFGTAGVVTYPMRHLELVAELAGGKLQGLDSATGPLRLAADGSPDTSFGANGTHPITRPIVSFPSGYESDGEWFAPVYGTWADGDFSLGLVRVLPDGTVDGSFGAGGASPPADRFIRISSVESFSPAFFLLRAMWEDQGGPHRTLRLADDTLLTLWTMSWQEDVPNFPPNMGTTPWQTSGLVLLAWSEDGVPRNVPAWGGRPARAIPNQLRFSFGANWLGWKYRCALLQPDGSILVGLEGEDEGSRPPQNRPGYIQTNAYFCRLVPPSFDLDSAFGTRFVVRRVPCQDEQVPGGPWLVERQSPAALASAGPGQVVAAISCQTATDPYIGIYREPPNLLADGSIGMARLV
jgi:uncharacterized delta-60 repeat protein